MLLNHEHFHIGTCARRMYVKKKMFRILRRVALPELDLVVIICHKICYKMIWSLETFSKKIRSKKSEAISFLSGGALVSQTLPFFALGQKGANVSFEGLPANGAVPQR